MSWTGSPVTRLLSAALPQGLRAGVKVTFSDLEKKDLVSGGQGGMKPAAYPLHMLLPNLPPRRPVPGLSKPPQRQTEASVPCSTLAGEGRGVGEFL